MATTTVVMGLNGVEIRKDFPEQLADKLEAKLSKDCNLTANDSYSRGYWGKITYELHCCGVDTVDMQGEVLVGTPIPEESNDVVIKGEVEVPLEADLGAVRERSNLPETVLTTDTEGQPVVQKRKYTRRIVAEAPPEVPGIGGGAVDID